MSHKNKTENVVSKDANLQHGFSTVLGNRRGREGYNGVLTYLQRRALAQELLNSENCQNEISLQLQQVYSKWSLLQNSLGLRCSLTVGSLHLTTEYRAYLLEKTVMFLQVDSKCDVSILRPYIVAAVHQICARYLVDYYDHQNPMMILHALTGDKTVVECMQDFGGILAMASATSEGELSWSEYWDYEAQVHASNKTVESNFERAHDCRLLAPMDTELWLSVLLMADMNEQSDWIIHMQARLARIYARKHEEYHGKPTIGMSLREWYMSSLFTGNKDDICVINLRGK